MAVLDDIKTLRNITDTSKDGKINIYIRRSITLIQDYLNIPITAITTTDRWTGVTTTIQPIDVEATYPDAIITYVIEQLQQSGNEGYKQWSEGSRSATITDGLSENVKALLPQPYVSFKRGGRYAH